MFSWYNRNYTKQWRPDKRLTKRKLVMTKASELNEKLLSMYKTQSDNLTITQKKRTKVQSIPQNLPTDLYLDEYENHLLSIAPLESDEEAKSEPQESIAEGMKFNPWKRKGTGLKILSTKRY